MAKERFRKARKHGYTTVENEILDDSKVSLEGKGLIAILLSNTDDWEIVMSEIISRSKNGRDAHYNVIRHLIEHGYYARVYLKVKGRHKELIHIFGAVKDQVKKELDDTVEEAEKQGYQCVVEYLKKQPTKKKKKAPVTENQEVEDKPNPPVTENQDTESSEAESSNAESQYNNNTKEQNPKENNTKGNKTNLNPNLNLDVTNTLWNTELPMKLKQWIKVKIAERSLSISNEQVLLLEEAYQYQISKGYIVSDCSSDYDKAINDNEFTGSISKMLDTVEKIDNMKGLVQSWVHKAFDFKATNLLKPFYEQESPFYNWLDDEE